MRRYFIGLSSDRPLQLLQVQREQRASTSHAGAPSPAFSRFFHPDIAEVPHFSGFTDWNWNPQLPPLGYFLHILLLAMFIYKERGLVVVPSLKGPQQHRFRSLTLALEERSHLKRLD